MKRRTFLSLTLGVALLLCACTGKPAASSSASTASSYPDSRDEVTKAFVDARYSDISSQTVEHGEDYSIQWADPAMEEHIRFLLDKPEGDIRHSDVWDLQVLVLRANQSDGFDVALEQPVSGDSFTFETVETNSEVRHLYNGHAFQNLSSLEDLKHFDSLQYFSYTASLPYDGLNDLSGLRECENLKVLYLCNVRPETLDPLGSLSELQTLTLYNCGALDLTPLKTLSALTSLSLNVDQIDSLEPLTALPQLSYLGIGSGSTYPSLEPLVQMNLRYLNMNCGMYDSDRYETLDYTPLTQMKSLAGLTLVYHKRVDRELCEAILANNPDLKYLDISYTKAAESGAKFDVAYLKDARLRG